MKIIILLILVMQISFGVAFAEEQYTRVGVMYGGTSALSLTVERHIGDMSVRLDIGSKGFLFCFAASVIKYANVKDVHPYIGIGVLNVHTFFKGKALAQYFNAPIGLDVRYGDGNAIGAEVDFVYLGEQKNYIGGPHKVINRFQPSSGGYYKKRQ
ncbi:hypothetical protein ACFL6P_05615 [Candidatus Latescibacterota bacterium]